MNQKKRSYLILIVLALSLSFLLPQGIRTASGYLSGRIQKALRQEGEGAKEEEKAELWQTKTFREPETVSQESREQGLQEESQERSNPVQEETTSYEAGLQRFRASFSPAYTESVAGGKEALLSDREEKLLDALAEYLYSEYQDLVTITQVDVVALVAEDEAEITGLLQLFSQDGETERYLCTYNKTYDFYGIYPYTHAESKETEEKT